MSVFIDMAVGDTLLIGNNTQLRVEQKSGRRARLAIDSTEKVNRVKRGEKLPAKPRQMPASTRQNDAPEPQRAARPRTPILKRRALA